MATIALSSLYRKKLVTNTDRVKKKHPQLRKEDAKQCLTSVIENVNVNGDS